MGHPALDLTSKNAVVVGGTSGIGLALVAERPSMAVLAPLLLPVVPMVTLVNYACEILFERKWSRRLRNELFRIPIADPLFEVTDVR